jgi:hypothetical protein
MPGADGASLGAASVEVDAAPPLLGDDTGGLLQDLVRCGSSIDVPGSAAPANAAPAPRFQASSNSMYQAFLDTNVVPNNSYLWKIKIPLKIRVFLWLLYREPIVTKDNLVKRKKSKWSFKLHAG